MKKTTASLSKLGITAEDPALPSSAKRFPDGAQYRIEIPSVETPEALSAVLEEADRRKVPIHRASQGSGIMMLTDGELTSMLKISRDAKIELSLEASPFGIARSVSVAKTSGPSGTTTESSRWRSTWSGCASA